MPNWQLFLLALENNISNVKSILLLEIILLIILNLELLYFLFLKNQLNVIFKST